VVEELVMRLLIAAATAAVFFVAGCSAAASRSTGHAEVTPVPLPADQPTVSALLKVATVFNNDYDSGVFGPAYDRWDARSQAVISRADYIRRHQECPLGPQTARVEDAERGPHGAWLVHYEIGGQQLTDYWFYMHRRWVFDLLLSNPSSVSLYRMTAQQYVKTLGCAH
jgi:hypothetical protein